MTYGELLQALYELSPSQLLLNVTVKINDEYIPLANLEIIQETDVLDQGHPCLIAE